MIHRIQQVLSALNEHLVDFVLCGGVACVLQGCERTTQDLDLFIALDQANLARAVAAFREIDLRPRIPEPMESLGDPRKRETWITEKNAIVYTLVSHDGFFQVDVFWTYPIAWHQLRQNADTIRIGGYDIAVSSKADLIRAKEYINPPREKDLWDIRVLKELEADG
jgi:hypothetical protein